MQNNEIRIKKIIGPSTSEKFLHRFKASKKRYKFCKIHQSLKKELHRWQMTVNCHGNLPTSERVRTQFSTLKRCDAPSQVHCDIRNAAWRSWTKMGCLVYVRKESGSVVFVAIIIKLLFKILSCLEYDLV